MKSQFNGVVYVTTCLINGKKYIGKDTKNNPSYLGSGKIIRRVISKYGRENFIKEILAEGTSNEDLCELEKYYISYYNAQNSNLFYNIAPGGDGGNVCDQSAKRVPINQYDRSGNFIKTWVCASEIEKSIGISRVKVVSSYTRHISAGGYLFKRADDASDIIIPPELGEAKRKWVYQYNSTMTELIGEYPSVTIAAKESGVNKTSIYGAVSGRIKNPTYKWVISNTESKYSPLPVKVEVVRKKVYQYTLDGAFVKSYESELDIPEEFSQGNIWSCLHGKRKSHKGYIWSYNFSKQKYEKAAYGSSKGPDHIVSRPRKPILMYNLDGTFIKETTVPEVIEEFELAQSNIWKVLHGRRKHTGGYYFEYK